jgi:hypothetical protein
LGHSARVTPDAPKHVGGLIDEENLVATNPNATALERYNQYRLGVGHQDVTSVLDPRRIEIGLRFKF